MKLSARVPLAIILLFALLTAFAAEGAAAPRCGRQGCPQNPILDDDGSVQASAAAAGSIPRPDLSQCHPKGRDLARSKYYEEMRKDTAEISKDIGATGPLYAGCHLFTGSTRNTCCKEVADTSLSKCKERIIGQEAAENPCAPKPVSCRLLKPFECVRERITERLRIKCCTSIDDQVLNGLLRQCEASVASVSAGCTVPETPTPAPSATKPITAVPEETPETRVTQEPQPTAPPYPSAATSIPSETPEVQLPLTPQPEETLSAPVTYGPSPLPSPESTPGEPTPAEPTPTSEATFTAPDTTTPEATPPAFTPEPEISATPILIQTVEAVTP